MSAAPVTDSILQLLSSFPDPPGETMAAEPTLEAVTASPLDGCEDDVAVLKRMRVATQEVLQDVATKPLNEKTLKALRLWSATTHPYAVTQQWEHALDTLAIRDASTHEDADTLSRAKNAVSDWYHRFKFGVSGTASADATAEQLARHTRGGIPEEGGAADRSPGPHADAFLGAVGSRSAPLVRSASSLDITIASPKAGGEAATPQDDVARDLHALDTVVRATQASRAQRRLAGRDKGVPQANGPDVRPDAYVLLLRPPSVGFPDAAAQEEVRGQGGGGDPSAPPLPAAVVAGAMGPSSARASISLPTGPAVMTVRPGVDHTGAPLTLSSLPALPGIKRGTVGAYPQPTPPHMTPVVDDQLPPPPAVVPRPGTLLPLPGMTEVRHPVTFTNIGRHKAKLTFRVSPPHPPASALVVVDPPTLVVRRGETAVAEVVVQLVAPGQDVTAMVFGEDPRGPRVALCVRALTAPQVFGVPHRTLTSTRDCGMRVPSLLRVLRQHMEATGGLVAEGVFRVAPGDGMVNRVRKALDAGTFVPASPRIGAPLIPPEGITPPTAEQVATTAAVATASACSAAGIAPTPDVSHATAYTAAHLIKMMFRRLPFPVLQGVPPKELLAVSGRVDALRLVREYVRSPHSDTLWWLVLLLARVAENEPVTRMGPKNCAIVAAPNLCPMHEGGNPMQALMVSQRTTVLLTHLIEYRMEMRAGAGGRLEEAEEVACDDPAATTAELTEISGPPTLLAAFCPPQTDASPPSPGTVELSVPPAAAARTPASSLGEMAIPPARGATAPHSAGARHHVHRASVSVGSYTDAELAAALATIRAGEGEDKAEHGTQHGADGAPDHPVPPAEGSGAVAVEAEVATEAEAAAPAAALKPAPPSSAPPMAALITARPGMGPPPGPVPPSARMNTPPVEGEGKEGKEQNEEEEGKEGKAGEDADAFTGHAPAAPEAAPETAPEAVEVSSPQPIPLVLTEGEVEAVPEVHMEEVVVLEEEAAPVGSHAIDEEEGKEAPPPPPPPPPPAPVAQEEEQGEGKEAGEEEGAPAPPHSAQESAQEGKGEEAEEEEEGGGEEE